MRRNSIALSIVLATIGQSSVGQQFSVNGTFEGGPDDGNLTANGHTVNLTDDDWFVALPSRNHLAARHSWENPADSLGGETPVRVRVTGNGHSVIAPIWDVGPQNHRDDYWDSNRDLTFIDNCSLQAGLPPVGVPEYAFAFDQGWHFGYTVSHPPPGSAPTRPLIPDASCTSVVDTGTQVLAKANRAGIDLAGGVFAGLGAPLAQGVQAVSWQFTTDLPAVRDVHIQQGNTVVFDLKQKISNRAASSGTLKVIIGFTETMQTINYPIVTLGQNYPYEDVTVTGGQWSQGVFVNDTWTGTVNLKGSPLGRYTMKINAADLGPTSAEPTNDPVSGGNEIDSNGGSGTYQPGPDTRVMFDIGAGLSLNLRSTAQDLFANLESSVLAVPTFVPIPGDLISFDLAALAGLQSIAITGPRGPITPTVAVQTVQTDTNGTFALAGAGTYKFEAEDPVGNGLAASFQQVDLSASLDSASHPNYSGINGSWGYSVTLDLNSTLGVDLTNQLDMTHDAPTSPTDVLATVTGSNQPVFQSTGTASTHPPNFSAEVVDTDGNFINYDLFLTTPVGGASFGPSVGADHFVDFRNPPSSGTLVGGTYLVPEGSLDVHGDGSYASPVFDLMQSSIMPGGFMRAGTWTDKSTGVSYDIPVLGCGLSGLSTAPVNVPLDSVGGQADAMSMALTILTGDTPLLDQQATLYNGLVDISTCTAGAGWIPPLATAPLKRYFQIRASFHSLLDQPVGCAQTDPTGQTCVVGLMQDPRVTFLGDGAFSLATRQHTGVRTFAQLNIGDNQSMDLFHGISIDNLNVTSDGEISVTYTSQEPEPGYQSVPPGIAFDVAMNAQFSGDPTLKMDLTGQNLTVAQAAAFQSFIIDPGSLTPPIPVSVSTSGVASMTPNLRNGAITIMGAVPKALNPVTTSGAGFALMYDGQLNPQIRIQTADASTSPVADMLASAALQGLVPLSAVAQFNSSGGQMQGDTSLRATYTPQTNVPLAGLYYLQPGASPQLLPSQYTLYLYPAVSAAPTNASGYYVVFGRKPPPPLTADVTPPVTTLVISPAISTDASGRYPISPSTLLSLNAVDPSVAGAQTSGVMDVLYVVDQDPNSPACSSVALDPNAPAGTCANELYQGPFTLSAGTHTVYYLSQDNALNVETENVASFLVQVDTVPPTTQLVLQGAFASDQSGNLFITTATLVAFTAADQGTPATGVAAIYYAVDSSAPVNGYTQPFALPLGPHTIVYASADSAGNVEPTHSTSLTVATTLPDQSGNGNNAPSFGLALATDASNHLWEVAQSNNQYFLERFTNGAQDAAIPLPDATNDGNWSIAFDTMGYVYAIGTTSGPFTVGGDLSVFKASLSGVYVSSAGYHGGVNGRAIGFDATGDIWISGAMQTPQGSFVLSLWRYCVHNDTLKQTATYSRGNGADAGFAVRVVNGNLWVAGYSAAIPVQQGIQLDLALWEFDPTGKNLIGGPFFRPSYLNNLNGTNARMEASASNLYVAATKSNASGGNDLAFDVFDLSGHILSEHQWTSSATLSARLGAVRLDASGNAIVAGGLQSQPSQLAVWTYSPLGVFLGAKTANAQAAKGLAIQGANDWLAVDGSSQPYLFAPSASLPGSDSSKASDTLPPRTALSIGAPSFAGAVLYATDETVFALSAVDDAAVAFDSAGVVAKTYVAVDTTSYSVYPGTFTLSGEGPHTIGYYSVDAAGNAEAPQSGSVSVDLTPPVSASTAAPSIGVFIASTSLISLSAIDSLSGVADLLYVVDQDPFSPACAGAPLDASRPSGTCANEAYNGPFSLAPGAHAVYFFAQDELGNQETVSVSSFSVDALPPRTALAIGQPQSGAGPVYVSPATPLSLVAVDDLAAQGDGLGAGVASTWLAVDTSNYNLAAGTFTLAAPGAHALSFYSFDRLLHAEALRSAAVTVDGAPPVTALLVNGQAAAGASLAIVSTDTLAFAAVDDASGVQATLYALDGTALGPAPAAFSLSTGAHTLGYQSRDNVGNLETLKTVPLSVRPPIAAPTVVILSPSGGGFETEAKSTFPVVGSVSGPSLAAWTLDYAAGQNASYGFTTLMTGSLAVSSSTLAVWDARALSGWQTLRLSAVNAVGDASSVSQNLYIGDPSLLLSLANLKLPTGVAIGPSGLIYVADTDDDQIAVFSAQGKLQATFDGFKAPEGVATDAFGNIYVADTGHDRAVRLTSLGQIALQLQGFEKPEGIAVDRAGYIYVSDSKNAQILKFSAAGTRVQAFALPQGRPAGLALDAAGNLYAADMKQKRLAVFDSSGTLRQSFSSDLIRPYGVAVSSDGTFIAVTDMALNTLESMNQLGQRVYAIGGIDSGMSGPRGATLDASGNLYLAERPMNRVIKIGPPPPGVAPVPIASPLAYLGERSAYVLAGSGGKLERSDHAGLILPPGALSDDGDVSLSTPVARFQAEEDLKARKLDEDGLVAISTGVVFEPVGSSLKAQAEFAVPYDSATMVALGVPDLQLRLYWWNQDKQDWFWCPARVDPATRTLHGRAMKFAHYRVLWRKDGQ